MKKLLIRSLVVCACALLMAFAANAQNRDADTTSKHSSPGVAVIKGTGKATVIVVGSVAKATWWTTKFTAKHVAAPILLHAAPAAGKFALKNSVKYLLPFAAKLSIL